MKKNRIGLVCHDYLVKKNLRIMKLTAFLILLSFAQLLANNSHAQKTKLSVDLKNTSIEMVLLNIESQSEFKFIYNKEKVDVNSHVSIQIKDKSIKETLDTVFKGKEVSYAFYGNQVILTNKTVSEPSQGLQQKSVSGKVTDSSGLPLPGVTVIVKGTTHGTITGANGNYSLSDVPENGILQFSFVGMKGLEVAVEGKTIINAIMIEEAVGIGEVVAVGYGTQKKVNLTGAVATISSKSLEKIAPVASTTNLLAGRISGLISKQNSGSPGRDFSSISIRGFGAPLIIVDGIESSFNNIDPNEIESISVLKDGAAAIYGARAGNGVVLITTRRGNDSKPTITASSSYSMQTITRFPDAMSSGQYTAHHREININAGRSEAQQTYSEADVAKYYEETDPDYPNTNWRKLMIRPYSPMQNHNISLSGGAGRVKYFGMLGYLKQETFWRNNGGDYKRFNIRSNLDAQITENLSAQVDFSNINEFRNFPARENFGNDVSLWQDYFQAHPIYHYSFPDPKKIPFAGSALGGIHVSSNRDLIGFADNDIHYIKASAALNYTIPFIKGLSARIFYNYSQEYDNIKQMNKPVDFYEYNYSADIYRLRGSWSPQASLKHRNAKTRSLTSQTSLNYNRSFGGGHTLSALALYETIDFSTDYIQAERSYFITPTIEFLFGGSPRDQFAFGSGSEMGRKSYVNRLNYAFKAKYLLEFSLRADASAKFPPEKRWGYFPSLSAGWRITEEALIKDKITWIDNAKLRLSLSNAGFDNVGNFAYLSGYNLGQKYIIGSTLYDGINETGLSNPDLTWEHMTTYNAGLDFSLYRSKLYGEMDVFYRKREGIPATRITSLPTTFGANFPPENLNSSNNRGFETLIGTKGTKGALSWDVSANVSWSRAKWDHYEEPDYSGDQESARVYQLSGTWIGRIMGYKTDGVYLSQDEINAMTFVQDKQNNKTVKPGDVRYIDINGDAVLDWKDMVELGKSRTPLWMYGMSVNLNYRNFDLALLFQGAGGNKLTVGIPANTLPRWEGRWIPESNNRYPLFPRHGSVAQGGNVFDYSLISADYLRLKNLNLGYELPERWLDFVKVKSCRLFFAGSNLFTIDKTKTFQVDPESPATGGSATYYPQQKTYAFGITLTL